jgi:hypothetical protein
MQDILQRHYVWGDLLTATIVLLALYFFLQFAHRVLGRAFFLGRFQEPVRRAIHNLRLVYELLVLLVIGGIFVLINPLFHGLLLVLLIFAGFAQIRNYVSGQIVQSNPHVVIGKRIRVDKLKGIIADLGRLNLQLQTREGLHYIGYARLLSEGYTLISGDEVGGLYQLQVRPLDSETNVDHIPLLLDKLASAPYLDWNHKPELRPSPKDPELINARLLVREENHLHELAALIGEWGYECRVKE